VLPAGTLLDAVISVVQTPLSTPRPLRIGAILARNTVWNYAGFVVNMTTSFLLLPFVVRHVGEAAAGLWLLLGAVTGYMGMMELGIVPALTQRVAAALGRGDRIAVDRAASTSLAVMAVMMIMAIQVVWSAHWLASTLNLPSELTSTATTAISLAIIGVALRMPQAPFQALLLGCQRQDRCSQLWIAMALTKALLTACIVSAGLGIVAVVAMEATVHLIAGMLQIHWTRQELPELRLSPSLVSWAEVRYLTSFGLQVTITGLFVLIVEQTDRLVIGVLRPIAEVTMYSAAWKLYMLAYTIPTTLVQPLGPVAATLHGSGERERLRDVFVRMSRYSFALALPPIVGLGLAGGWLLDIWLGDRFVAVLPVLQVLLVSLLVTSVNHPGYAVIVGSRCVGHQMWIYNAPLAVANLTLSVWLVQRYGLIGVALGTAIPAIVFEYPFLRLVTSIVGMSVKDYVAVVVRPTLVPATVIFFPALIVAAGAPRTSVAIVAATILCSGVYVVWFWLRGLSYSERSSVLQHSPTLPDRLNKWLLGRGV
jgi:O-antigen/teichoic acid export membrane protein